MKDDLIDEMQRIKKAHAAKYKYDILAMAKALRAQDRRSGRKVVNLGPCKLAHAGK